MDHIVLGLLGGLLGAVYLTFFFGVLHSKSWFGLFLFLGMSLITALPSKFELSWLPDPTRILDSWGLNASADLSGPGVLSLLLSMVGGVVLAYFSGLIKLVSRFIDRFSAAIAARFRRPENPMNSARN
ncbi:hypothetical protein CQ018_07545 [Arthrobacter sp. MYb227]|uniref:hypothetical protein n=1 Tax=Arthrobacter sp. MYb227 TaxID=1848601 RepID=UPI000CFD6A9F|nr:hypothetical protein [Arthrobacter sp. MYb227]PQZ93527.1 hypothetical protein CQ018_07545 [Arthrobacter sp. MYb227]